MPTKTRMMRTEKFAWRQWYIVIEDHDIQEPSEPRLRLKKTFCYKLRVGMELQFKGPNWDGMASFVCRDGRLVFLTPKLAFRVIGRIAVENRKVEKPWNAKCQRKPQASQTSY